MRVTTAFNKMLAIPGATTVSVTFTAAGVVVRLRRRRSTLRCPCGFETRSSYDSSIRRWRHLDLGSCRLLLEAEIRRLACRHCRRIRTEEVPWARPAARHSRDFEDVVAFLAQRVDKTAVARLMRCSWEAVANIVTRVVADHIDGSRLEELYRIGVDEIFYRKPHRFLTVIADHDRDGAVVWAKDGRDADTLKAFYDELGEDRKARLRRSRSIWAARTRRLRPRWFRTPSSASIRSMWCSWPTRRSIRRGVGRGTTSGAPTRLRGGPSVDR